MIEISDANGVIMALCPCHNEAAVIDASHAEIDPDHVRSELLGLIGHARRCPAATPHLSGRIDRLLAERFPKIP